jgi:hypothetical protein
MRAVTLHRTYGSDPLRRVSDLVCPAMGRTIRGWCGLGEGFLLLRLRERPSGTFLMAFSSRP